MILLIVIGAAAGLTLLFWGINEMVERTSPGFQLGKV